MRLKVNYSSMSLILTGGLIILTMNFAGCKESELSTNYSEDKTSVENGCSTVPNGADNLPNIAGYPNNY